MIRSLVVLVAVARVAAADPRDTARIYYKAGEIAFEKDDLPTAVVAYERAYLLSPEPVVLYNLIKTNIDLLNERRDPAYGRTALRLCEKYLDTFPAGEKRAEVEEYYRALPAAITAGAQTPQLPVPTPATQIMVLSTVPEARASIDGPLDTGGQTPYWRKDLAPGRHVLTVGGEGLESTTVELFVEAAALEVREINPAASPGHVVIETRVSGAEVRIDGRSVGIAPSGVVDVPAGKHHVEVVRRGRQGIAVDLELARGERRTIEAELPTTGQRRVAIGVGIGASVTLGSAVVLGLLARRADDDTAVRPPASAPGADKRAYNDAIARRDALALGANVCLAIGATAAVAAVGLAYFDRHSTERRAGIAVAPARDGALVVIGGGF